MSLVQPAEAKVYRCRHTVTALRVTSPGQALAWARQMHLADPSATIPPDHLQDLEPGSWVVLSGDDFLQMSDEEFRGMYEVP